VALIAMLWTPLSMAQPPNDLCGPVVPVQILPGGSFSFTGTTIGATYAGDATSGPLADGVPKVWHAFTVPVCSDVTLAYCGSSVMGTTYIVISSNCPSSSFVFNSGVNTTDCADGNWTYQYNDLPAGTYYAPVGAFADFLGDYTLTISAAVCSGAPIVVNDGCSTPNPVALAMGSTRSFAGTTVGATYTNDATGGPLADNVPKVWHAFTTAQCADVTVSYCGSSWFGDTYIGISTNCPSSTLVFNSGVNLTDCADGNWTYSYDALPAGTYYVPIGAFPNALGPYQLNISAVPCIPTGLVGSPGPALASLSPNPTNDLVQVRIPDGAWVEEVVVMDALGRKQLSAQGQAPSIDLGGLPAGNYLLLARDRDGRLHPLGPVMKL
jgi:hypothetical protein